MASTDAIPVPRKNTAYRFYFAIRKPSDSTLITTWAGQDSEVSLDGAAYSDCTNEATEIGTTGTGYIDLTSSEMNADCVLLKVTVTNTGAVPLVFALYPESAGDYRVADTQKVDVETIKTNPVVNGGTITFPSGATLASTTNITAGTITTVTTTTTATNLTNLPAITPSWLTATGIAADAITAAKIADGAIDAAKIADGAIDAATFAAGAITATVIATGAIDADALATDAVNEIVDQVWDEVISGHATAGSTGAALSAAGGSGDPWATALPGAYSSGTAGHTIGTYIDAAITSRMATYTQPTGFLAATFPSDPADQSAVEAAITAATSPLATAANLATVAGYLDTEIAAILADTNELQTDWANGGRLDLILDARASQTSVDTIDDLLDTEVAALTTQLGLVKDRVSYCLTVLVGACSDAGTSAETYVFAIGGETFTADYTGLDATGNRTTTTLSKV